MRIPFFKAKPRAEAKGRPVLSDVSAKVLNATRGFMDSIAETLSGLGGSTDRFRKVHFEPPEPVTQKEIEWALEFSGIMEGFLLGPVEDALSGGIEFPKLSEEETAAVNDYLDSVGFWDAMETGYTTMRMNHGSAVWLDTKSINPSQPMGKRERLRELIVFDSEALHGEMTSKYRMPEFYSTGESIVKNNRIHKSRLLIFPGRFVSFQYRHDHNGWGAREADKVWESFIALLTAFTIPPNAAITFEEPVYGMDGLNKNMTSEVGRAAIQAKVMDLEAARSFLKVRVKDVADTFERVGVPLAGVENVLRFAERYFVANTRQPHTVVMGESPGMTLDGGGSGDNQRAEYQRYISKQQGKYLYPVITQFLNFSRPELQARYGLPFKDLSFEFPPVYTESQKDRADREYKEAQRDDVYLKHGVLDQEEARDDLSKRGVYSLDFQAMPEADPVDLDGADA